jgi:hypothetical protein
MHDSINKAIDGYRKILMDLFELASARQVPKADVERALKNLWIMRKAVCLGSISEAEYCDFFKGILLISDRNRACGVTPETRDPGSPTISRRTAKNACQSR